VQPAASQPSSTIPKTTTTTTAASTTPPLPAKDSDVHDYVNIETINPDADVHDYVNVNSEELAILLSAKPGYVNLAFGKKKEKEEEEEEGEDTYEEPLTVLVCACVCSCFGDPQAEAPPAPNVAYANMV
jgi:hypothetical protein